MISCSRAVNHVSEISRLTQRIWCWVVPPHLVFVNLGIALPHAVLKLCSAWWTFVWLGFFCTFIDSYRHLNCCVFLTLPNSSCIKRSYLLVTTTEHLPLLTRDTGTNESLSPDLHKLWNYTTEKCYLVMFLTSIETGDYKYPPWWGF